MLYLFRQVSGGFCFDEIFVNVRRGSSGLVGVFDDSVVVMLWSTLRCTCSNRCHACGTPFGKDLVNMLNAGVEFIQWLRSSPIFTVHVVTHGK